MKTLCLVRHAKSSKDDPTLADKDRPLAERGRKQAREMGQRLARHHAMPDRVLCSPALRARATAEAIADEMGYARADIAVDDRLYASSADELLAVIREFDDELDCVMLFGHNPEFTELAHWLSSDIVDMPTCAVAEFCFDTKRWSDVGNVRPDRATVDRPRG